MFNGKSIFISGGTYKGASPINLYGATRLLSYKLFLSVRQIADRQAEMSA